MQTALEYLLEQIVKYDVNIIKLPHTYQQICDDAFKMETDQIRMAWENGALPAFIKEHKCSRDYFEQTYKKHGDETF
jgi:hypothetical protein